MKYTPLIAMTSQPTVSTTHQFFDFFFGFIIDPKLRPPNVWGQELAASSQSWGDAYWRHRQARSALVTLDY
jgi:hypothetical protein